MRKLLTEIIFTIVFIAASIFQIATTNLKTAYLPTPAEADLRIKRMNMYPPKLARLGYWLEEKRETQIAQKVMFNFFTAVDPKEYFPSKIPWLFSPFILMGLYFFVSEWRKRKIIFWEFVSSILSLTVIGSYAKYGPVIVYLFFIVFFIVFLQKIFKFKIL